MTDTFSFVDVSGIRHDLPRSSILGLFGPPGFCDFDNPIFHVVVSPGVTLYVDREQFHALRDEIACREMASLDGFYDGLVEALSQLEGVVASAQVYRERKPPIVAVVVVGTEYLNGHRDMVARRMMDYIIAHGCQPFKLIVTEARPPVLLGPRYDKLADALLGLQGVVYSISEVHRPYQMTVHLEPGAGEEGRALVAETLLQFAETPGVPALPVIVEEAKP